MNKKVLLCLLTVMLLLTGCNKKNEVETNSKKNNSASSKSVVVYFSATGTTKEVAQKIANNSSSDIIEIIPKEKYTSDDLNYNSDCRANKEQNDSSARPEIENQINIDNYDVVYLGYPIWWGTYPKIILSFIDLHDFDGKTIIPFCTSGSSSINTSISDLRKYKPDLDIKDGKRFSSSTADSEITDFINNK